MIFEATFRKIALSLPEAKEQDFRGRPSFRVGGKIFATLHADEGRAVVKLSLADQKALVKSDPRTYSLMPFSYLGSGRRIANVSFSRPVARAAEFGR